MRLTKHDEVAKKEDDYNQDAQERATQLGLNMVEPLDNILLLDLDTPEQEAMYKTQLEIFNQLGSIKNTFETVSKSGKKHVYIALNSKHTMMARIGLQAILGSDPKRELLSMMRAIKGTETATVLFETNSELEKLVTQANIGNLYFKLKASKLLAAPQEEAAA